MKTVCVQGLGFVGAAMSTAISLASDENKCPLYDVIGVDLPGKPGDQRVNSINAGKFPFETNDKYLIESVNKAHKKGNLRATMNPSVYSKADIVVVDVQLDIHYLDNQPQLKLEGFKRAINIISEYIKPGALVLVETTVPPGTCEKIVGPVIRKGLEKRGIDPLSVYIAHSYERVMPGKHYLRSITDYWRVFAGNTKKAGDICETFLNNIVNVDKYPLTRLPSTIASETAKIMENTYRAANIAFIDEWTKYAESVGIDLFEVIDAIKIRPSHSNIRFPGLGVGGYCLTKDPIFASAASKQLFNKDLDFPFSRMAVRVNHDMPMHTISRLKLLLNGVISGKRLLVCGITYRQDVEDTRYSASERFVRELIRQNAIVICHDPYVRYWEEMDLALSQELPELTGFDAVIFAVPHEYYRQLDILTWFTKSCVVLDANSVFNNEQRKIVRSQGIRIESIGRGDGL